MRALAWCVPLVLTGAIGCGRVGFELLPAGDDQNLGGGDADAGPGGGNRDASVGDGTDAGGTDAGSDFADVCVDDVCISDLDLCMSNADKTVPGICGCGTADSADADDDGTPDCNDRCANAPDVLASGACGCSAASADDDNDGTPNCHDACPDDADKRSPAVCGCGTSDADDDGDGIPDCADQCASDPGKAIPGTCGCGTDEDPTVADDDCDGVDDDCNGDVDEDFPARSSTCGVGACAAGGSVTCEDGRTQDSCEAGTGTATDDDCDGVDDDCDGEDDEDYEATSVCGDGVCASTGVRTCVDGSTQDSCTPGTPPTTVDGPVNGVDDDCDGTVDENGCTAAPEEFTTAGLRNITVPANCGSMTVQLWGAGGASGNSNSGYWGGGVTGGAGGPGGFAQNSFTVSSSSTITLRVGQGGVGCGANSKGLNDTTYDGGNGAAAVNGNGSVGAGTETGGTGATSGGDGGSGFFGGGGGGSGQSSFSQAGPGGGGGAASVLFVDATRLLAGGGGGGGGAGSTIITNGVSGGAGGSGCSGNGSNGAGTQGGGGGGGGKCDATNNMGTGTSPHVPVGVTLPAGTAAGGANSGDCLAGGAGYAKITWAP